MKLSGWWDGPFVVQKKIGQNVYVLDLGGGESMDAHADQLKVFHDDIVLTGGIPLFHHQDDPPPQNLLWRLRGLGTIGGVHRGGNS